MLQSLRDKNTRFGLAVIHKFNIIPAFIRGWIEFLGLPLELVYVSHVVLYVLLNRVAAEAVAMSADLRITTHSDGAIDWARSVIPGLRSSDCFLDIDGMKYVDSTIEYVRVLGVKRVMPAKWCLPPAHASRAVAEEARKLERLTEFMKAEAARMNSHVLGAIEVNVNVHAVLFEGQLMLNPRLIGSGPTSDCTVSVLGEEMRVVYPKHAKVRFETFFGDVVERHVSGVSGCLLAAF